MAPAPRRRTCACSARSPRPTARPSTGWNPNLNGAVKDLDATDDGARVYATGYFTTENGAAAKNAAAISTAAGAPLVTPTWAPVWSSTKSYQQAIQQVGSKLWVGGSEHSLFQYDPSTFTRTAGDIMKSHGDIQAITADRGVVFAGCHCDQYDYSNAYTWPTLTAGWTQAEPMGWFAAWDASTGQRMPNFVPTFNLRLNEGIWAIQADSTGTVWAGGDILTVRTNAQQARWSGGFARFPLADADAPTTPTGLTATGQDSSTVSLSWTKSTDSGGGVRYEVLRDDRPIASTSDNTASITVPKGGNNRFFVRAVDAAGNVSASTGVLNVSTAAPTASFTSSVDRLAVSFNGSASVDPDGSIASYSWNFGDSTSGTGATPTHTYAAAGTYPVTLTVTDNMGAQGSTTANVTAVAPPASSVVVDNGQSWRWKYDATAPPAGWNTAAFDSSGWQLGNAVLGFGGTVATNIDTFATTSLRPRAAYFTKTFTVADPSQWATLTLSTVANDGVVVYVNGTEVARSNIPAGTVTNQTFANAAPSTTKANSTPLVIQVPASALVAGTNVVSAETHLNTRSTADVSFDLKATLTSNG